ncbi:tRNA uridine-5-carboxymethylaminomethyl(34) synthesis GTPase MnmE [Shumkonia mesophila]|uniref:tRNA uridine-5-carboxymethylaminomethyl(34) synthesis GTPase MnmE n=1 Tax=Shumkonia mesophila TaxID=2838854 RepID=UPI002934E77D|nr:tRNA uridine-5-carboxymethylaminomethyl(34) synthesis GTPase MnmE [Shumkonia mesophila]
MKSGTIYALASASGPAGVAVIRLSGPEAGEAWRRLTGIPLPPPRRLVRMRFTDPDTGEVLDDGLGVWFAGPASFTGEDVVEFHLHGGRAVVAGALAALGRIGGLRLAEPGEFTRRAFENGRMDLTAAEGLADLVAAETAAQRRQALRQMQGALGALYEEWREDLLRDLAHVEAAIDFADEDLPEGLIEEVRRRAAAVRAAMADHLADGRRGERLRDGVQVAIVGPPNAGKSSLLNLLARREAAIVAETAGTTRDVIEVHLDLAGIPVVVADTAGLRDGGDAVECEGVRRAQARAAEADVRIALFDATRWPETDGRTAALVDGATVVAINKSDITSPPPPLAVNGVAGLAVSVRTGIGIDGLMARLAAAVAECCPAAGAPAMTRARHREALEACVAALDRFLSGEGVAPELAAEDLRLATRALGRITGRVDVEDVLDVIFREFCIGK